MANRSDPDIDDDFSEIYKEYSGPPRSTVSRAQDRVKENKRSHAGSDEEEERRDLNAVPTDFTSREAKFWEAKSKATERNWKKRKGEEMICKICGESGHFTQGCPSTLGAKRKSQDFLERVPARETHVRALFTEKVIQKIEKDIGCKIKMDEKFIIVSGKDRLVLKKGVDAVHRVKDENQRGSSSSQRNRSRSHLSHSKSPGHLPYAGNSYNSYDGHNQNMGANRTDRWDTERRGSDLHSANQFQYIAFPQTLDEFELEYKRGAMELGRIRDKEEDEENYKHREKAYSDSEYDGSLVNAHYTGANLPMDSRGRYPNPMENYPSRPHDSYGEFQSQRREDFGKAYNRSKLYSKNFQGPPDLGQVGSNTMVSSSLGKYVGSVSVLRREHCYFFDVLLQFVPVSICNSFGLKPSAILEMVYHGALISSQTIRLSEICWLVKFRWNGAPTGPWSLASIWFIDA
ncbi:hypothetical protein CRYUN_Cryun14cG0076300 [Craigia yunnanensis]